MKKSLLLLASLSLFSNSAFAIAERKCTDEVLTCRLEKQLMAGGVVFVAEKAEKFSGINEDEPSIEPDECTLHLLMAKDKINLNVKVGDSNYMASIFTVHDDNLGRVLPGSASFPIVKGQRFYYGYDQLVLSCVLE